MTTKRTKPKALAKPKAQPLTNREALAIAQLLAEPTKSLTVTTVDVIALASWVRRAIEARCRNPIRIVHCDDCGVWLKDGRLDNLRLYIAGEQLRPLAASLWRAADRSDKMLRGS